MKNIVVVTGGAGGIGLASAKMFKDDLVLLADLSEENLNTAKADLQADGFDVETQVVDLSDLESIENLFKKAKELGNIKTVINSAGVSGGQAPSKLLYEINLLGTQRLIDQASKVMDKDSSIVLVSSMMGHSVPEDPMYLEALTYPEKEGSIETLVAVCEDNSDNAYNFSKKGVHLLNKRYAYELGQKKIRINSVSPGVIMTAMSKKAEEDHPEVMAGYRQMTPVGRMGEVEDIAEVVKFLASDKASFITGTDILADGGLIIKIMEQYKQ